MDRLDRRLVVQAAAVASLSLSAAACWAGSEGASLRVLAASSLTEPLQRLQALTADHLDVPDVVMSFDGSQRLRAQIERGMPFDLFLSAHRRDVDRLLRAGAIESPQRLATNRLVLTCRRSARCDQLTWDALPGVQRLGVGLKSSPIGEYTEALLERAAHKFGADWLRAVQAQTVTQEPNVRRLRAQVALGALDAAIVYASDVATDDRFRAVRPPQALDRPTELWLAVRAGAGERPAVQRFLKLLGGQQGRRALTQFGLGVP